MGAGFALLERDVDIGMNVPLGSAVAVNFHILAGEENKGFDFCLEDGKRRKRSHIAADPIGVGV